MTAKVNEQTCIQQSHIPFGVKTFRSLILPRILCKNGTRAACKCSEHTWTSYTAPPNLVALLFSKRQRFNPPDPPDRKTAPPFKEALFACHTISFSFFKSKVLMAVHSLHCLKYFIAGRMHTQGCNVMLKVAWPTIQANFDCPDFHCLGIDNSASTKKEVCRAVPRRCSLQKHKSTPCQSRPRLVGLGSCI